MQDDASDITVGVQGAYAVTAYFYANNGEGKKYNAKEVKEYGNQAELYKALDDGAIDAVVYGTSDAAGKIAAGGYEMIGQQINDWANGVSFACHPSKADVVA